MWQICEKQKIWKVADTFSQHCSFMLVLISAQIFWLYNLVELIFWVSLFRVRVIYFYFLHFYFVCVNDGELICVIQIWWDREPWTVAGLSLWWLITIHLAAAVNIDSSRDFQFEPCDILWNITKCVEVSKEIGRKGGTGLVPRDSGSPPSPTDRLPSHAYLSV